MPFIGNQPTQGRFIELDSLTASATDDYTLQLNGANFSPESVNNLLVSINGVIQGSSTMSLNGAVLTVGATLSSSDTIDFVRVFGNVGTVSTPTDGSVTANKIGTGAVDLTSKVSGVLPVANGGTGSSSFTASTMTLATTVASTSGTAIDFTGIPSNAKRISVIFRGVSSSASDTGALVQLGTSGGFVTSGYLSTSHYGTGGSSDTTGFYIYGIGTSNILSAIMTITHMGSNIYVNAHSGKYNSSNGMFGGGDVAVGGTVTQVRIKQVSGGAFDAGSINIMYES